MQSSSDSDNESTRDILVSGLQITDIQETISQDRTIVSDSIHHTIPDVDAGFNSEDDASSKESSISDSTSSSPVIAANTDHGTAELDSISQLDVKPTPKGETSKDTGSLQKLQIEELQKLLREKIDNLLGLGPTLDSHVSCLVDHLLSTISRLRVQNDMLIKELNQTKAAATVFERPDSNTQHDDSSVNGQGSEPRPDDHPCFDVLHEVFCYHLETPAKTHKRGLYLDIPCLFQDDSRNDHIRGLIDVEDTITYLKLHRKTAFALIYSYTCSQSDINTLYYKSEIRNGRLIKNSSHAKTLGEKLHVGLPIHKTLQDIMLAHPDRFKGYAVHRLPRDFSKPYFFFYIHNTTFLELLPKSNLDPWASKCLLLLLDWMEKNWRNFWDEADELFSRKVCTEATYKLLFRPGELIIHMDSEEKLVTAAKINAYPWMTTIDNTEAQRWEFNGSFYCDREILFLRELPLCPQLMNAGGDWRKKEHEIRFLPWYPISFAPENLRDKLVARGSRFWACRKKTLVCYSDSDDYLGTDVQDRFMIDYKMYRRLYPKKDMFDVRIDDNERLIVDKEGPPDDDFLACLPATIHGFSFSSKSWRILRVDRITDVTWNKDAFRQLVAADETKELIQAVVTAHGQRLTSAPDIIEGKGKGLLILLHGGPGTGKTLTAESIADQQERPLYRVTCGDIGTEPADVEKYLSAVLEIGKAWGCVVLLDEADVFLEERSFTDQKRNAIISIFLRVLEYYDGILILTTNRVGSFDEAFKSRIQLALGYPKLTEEDRLKIWQNFVQMLSRSKERIDIDDLDMNLHKLARFEMNGRQIRNIITMARHLAKYRKEILRFKHMQDAVRSAQKFNEYLDQVKGVSDDTWAREDKLR